MDRGYYDSQGRRLDWCGVCENKNPNCLTCKDTRAWVASIIDEWLDKQTPKWYPEVSETEKAIKERLEIWTRRT